LRLKRRRQHPLPWLSLHKLGRPFGLAGLRPVGREIANGFDENISNTRRPQSLATTYSSIA
jgi:hypothetical protein